MVAALCCALAGGGAAQQHSGGQTTKVRLDTSETVFSVLAALNACGYDAELSSSNPLRTRVRAEIAQNVLRSAEAQQAQQQLCAFYRNHQQPDSARNISQYVSLALNLGEPPAFELTTRESDLPPDAAYMLGFVRPLQRFYQAAGLHGVWREHQRDYEALIEQIHDPVARMRLETDVYLKLASSGYLGRSFTVFVEPMGAPGQVNSRNYGSDYFLVVSPSPEALRMYEVRHTYLHYVLDPLAMKRANAMKRMEPLLAVVQKAPIEENFKYDVSLLVTESLIQAIEARTIPGGKAAEPKRLEAMQAAMKQGYILTRYFHDALAEFEKSPTGLKDAYGDMLHNISVAAEKKRAQAIEFSRQAAPEVVGASNRSTRVDMLDQAESRLASGDSAGARKLAQQALDQRVADPARAMFILARAATLAGDLEGARQYFERTLQIARQPRTIAWSHIYLARIFDLQEEREAALTHYRAALSAGDTTPDTRTAAERGLQQPYQPGAPRQ